jgi:hypothetical protein
VPFAASLGAKSFWKPIQGISICIISSKPKIQRLSMDNERTTITNIITKPLHEVWATFQVQNSKIKYCREAVATRHRAPWAGWRGGRGSASGEGCEGRGVARAASSMGRAARRGVRGARRGVR